MPSSSVLLTRIGHPRHGIELLLEDTPPDPPRTGREALSRAETLLSLEARAEAEAWFVRARQFRSAIPTLALQGHVDRLARRLKPAAPAE